MGKRNVVTLCGSTRWHLIYAEINARLTMSGQVVLSCGIFGHTLHDMPAMATIENKKSELDRLHKYKIRMSDYIYVIDPYGYKGSSTRSEIEYACVLGLDMVFFSTEWKFAFEHRSWFEYTNVSEEQFKEFRTSLREIQEGR